MMRKDTLRCTAIMLALASTSLAATEKLAISGKVVDQADKPVAAARVEVCRSSYLRRGQCESLAVKATETNGTFAFPATEVDPAQQEVIYLIASKKGLGFACSTLRPKPKGDLTLKLCPLQPLRGTVKLPDGSPAPGVAVRLSSTRFRQKDSKSWTYVSCPGPVCPTELCAKTDAAGKFELLAIPPGEEGRIELAARLESHARWAGSFTVADAEQGAEIQLEKGGSIEGQVTYEKTGKPAGGMVVACRAYIRARRAGISAEATTGTDGRYAIRDLPMTDYTLWLALGKDSQWTCSSKRGISVRTEATTGAVDLVLTRGSVVKGKATDSKGAPLANVSIWAHGQSANSISVTTGDDGTYQLRLPPGKVELRVTGVPSGYVRPGSGSRRRVAVLAGKDVEDVNFVIQRGSTLTGSVKGPDGKPMEGVKVVARQGWNRVAEVKSDEEGKFSIDGVPPEGELILVATSESAGLGKIMTMARGEKRPTALEMQLEPFGTLRGKIVTSDGKPIPDVRVNVMRREGRSFRRPKALTTDKEGRYEFRGPAGTYGIAVGQDHWNRQQATVDLAAGKERSAENIIWVAARKTTIAGVVVDPEGKPAKDVQLTLRIKWETDSAVTDAQGRFRFGEKTVEKETPLLIVCDEKRRLATMLDVPLASADKLTVKLAKACALTGRVVDDQGKALKSAQVRLWGAVGSRSYSTVKTATTGTDGTYTLDALVPGREQYLKAEAPGYGSFESKHMALEPGEERKLDDIVLAKADSFLAGTVKGQDGEPLAGARVYCYGRGADRQEATTDAKGRFRFDGIPKTARLDVNASREGYRRDSLDDVVPGGEVQLVLWQENRSRPEKKAEIGKPAPELASLDWLGPKAPSPKSLQGKTVLLHFWSMFTRSSAAQADRLKQLHRDYASKGLTVVLVHGTSATPTELREFAQKHALSFAIARVKPAEADGWLGDTFAAYGVDSVPRSFLVDREGTLRYEGDGRGLKERVVELMGG